MDNIEEEFYEWADTYGDSKKEADSCIYGKMQMIDFALHLIKNHSSYTMLATVPYQCCPICNGTGNVPAPSYTSGVTITCDTCSGQKIIPHYIVPQTLSEHGSKSVECPECMEKVEQEELDIFGGLCENCTTDC